MGSWDAGPAKDTDWEFRPMWSELTHFHYNCFEMLAVLFVHREMCVCVCSKVQWGTENINYLEKTCSALLRKAAS